MLRTIVVLLVVNLAAAEEAPRDPEKAWGDVLAALRERDSAESGLRHARSLLCEFVREWPESPHVPEAVIRLRELARAGGDPGVVARLLEELERDIQASHELEQSPALPVEHRVWFRWIGAELAIELRRYREAVQCFAEVLDSPAPEALHARAREGWLAALVLAGEPERARDELRASRPETSPAGAHWFVARTLGLSRESDRAVPELSRFLSEHPDHPGVPEAALLLALHHEREGRSPAALALCERALGAPEAESDVPAHAHQLRATILRDQGDYAAALVDARALLPAARTVHHHREATLLILDIVDRRLAGMQVEGVARDRLMQQLALDLRDARSREVKGALRAWQRRVQLLGKEALGVGSEGWTTFEQEGGETSLAPTEKGWTLLWFTRHDGGERSSDSIPGHPLMPPVQTAVDGEALRVLAERPEFGITRAVQLWTGLGREQVAEVLPHAVAPVFPLLIDRPRPAEQALSERLGIDRTPMIVLLAPGGEVRAFALTPSELEALLAPR